jgi:CheY-like chemotaxis protein
VAIAGRPRARQQAARRRCVWTPSVEEALRTYAEALSAAGRPAPAAPPAGKRVLIVALGGREAFALAGALETGGLDVAFAEDEIEAVERLTTAPGADLVVVDAVEAEDALSAIRAVPDFAALPVVVLGPQDADQAAAQRLVAGATGYLSRPVDVDGLLPLIRTWLGP